jgi:catechol 2,3-dioxygenase-like lactoylglutathione lyase family enzyme
MIKSFAFVCYPVKDVAKATAFYRDVVGLKPALSLSERWSEFDLDGATFAVASGGEAMGFVPGSANAVAFEVDDLDATIDRLRAKGLRMDEAFEAPTCRACFAYDLDGNKFALHQLKK